MGSMKGILGMGDGGSRSRLSKLSKVEEDGSRSGFLSPNKKGKSRGMLETPRKKNLFNVETKSYRKQSRVDRRMVASKSGFFG